ncbi:MAG: TonB-dependent receptor plug domain-containing protein [Aphanocapsa sp. GSE-SYN-MK-11-07L]|jgi:iron complex outermembrane receptor protein|nr:TonB-dependent receptor plug domain-containing protein [Aphanocapsa sp. GSE-SYN-MK-11-07L]
MKMMRSFLKLNLAVVLGLSAGLMEAQWSQPGWTQAAKQEATQGGNAGAKGAPLSLIMHVHDLDRPATTVKDWVAQIEATIVQVTSVKLNPTDTGLEIVLETQDAKPLPVDATKFRSEGSSLIADIPNTVLALPNAQVFTAENPTADIATVQVVQQADSRIRISVTGKTALPKTEVTLKTGAFAYSLNPEVEEPEEEIVVTGQGEGSYFVPDTSLATKTNTPIRDIPASIQIVPQEVLRDRNVRSLTEAVETVSGVISRGNEYDSSGSSRTIRGFEQAGNFRNGFRDAPNTYVLSSPIGVVEQVEVLKGPASVLFGDIEPGGIVNVTTKRPLSEPAYTLSFEAGNRNFYQPGIDFTGSLTTDKNLLYRFIVNYQTKDGYQEFVNSNQVTAAPSITWKIGDRTELNTSMLNPLPTRQLATAYC